MDPSVNAEPAGCHRRLPDTRPRMVKAHLRKAETSEWRARMGTVIARVMHLRGWTLKEFAAAVERDERQCGRWMNGLERPQFDAVMAVESLQQLVVLALAEIAGSGVELETTVRIRRRA